MESGQRYLAILLVGLTSSGKTPLGILLEKLGVLGQRCVHFDFGEEMRQIARMETCPDFLTQAEFEVIKSVLKSGSLLDDSQFVIAQKILSEFCQQRAIDDQVLILNGFPRHRGQAEDINSIVDVRVIVSLECSVEVALQRISSNVGGDRTGRSDDEKAMVARKLAIFQEQTVPLLGYYQSRQATIISLPVTALTTAEQLREELMKKLPN